MSFRSTRPHVPRTPGYRKGHSLRWIRSNAVLQFRSLPRAVLVVVACEMMACRSTPTLDEAIAQVAVQGSAASSETARHAIMLAANDERAAIRRGAIDAILHLEGREFSSEVHRALQDVHPAIRLQAARALERWGTPADAEALEHAAAIDEEGDTPEAAAEMAAYAAARARIAENPEPAQRAVQELSSSTARVRMLAAVHLGYYRWAPSVPKLQQAILSERDGPARAMAACALASFDPSAVGPVLSELESLLNEPDPLGRRCAVKALGASGESKRAALVARGLRDRDGLTRRWTVTGLRRLGAVSDYRRALTTSARTDTDVAVRAEALKALADARVMGINAILTQALSDPAPRVRGVAAQGLARAGDANAMQRTLADPAWEVRVATLIGLARRTPAVDAVN